MNPFFLPNKREKKQIEIIQKYYRKDFALIRMTETMLDKSIIDASFEIRSVLKDADIVNYSMLGKGPSYKLIKESYILESENLKEAKVSYYRPVTKNGDPRFWVYGLKKVVKENDLVYFTVFENNLLSIPLNENVDNFEETIEKYFSKEIKEDIEIANNIVDELIGKLSVIKEKGWIESVNLTGKVNPRDAGDTLEREVGIEANNLVSPDYMGEIEIKTKVSKTGTSDTLFSCVPNWDISEIKTSREMILKYGYPSRKEKYSGYLDLYVTVNNKPNNQGLYLENIDDEYLLAQNYFKEGVNAETCKWEYSNLKSRLLSKHPKTVWIVAEHKKIDGINYFYYHKLEFTQNPIFSQFLLLISQGDLTFDWRGRVKPDGTGYKDKGHAFRLKPKKRHFLFGETKEIIF